MTEMTINPATVILTLVVIALVVWALRRLKERGVCDCKDCTGDCGACASSGKMSVGEKSVTKAAK